MGFVESDGLRIWECSLDNIHREPNQCGLQPNPMARLLRAGFTTNIDILIDAFRKLVSSFSCIPIPFTRKVRIEASPMDLMECAFRLKPSSQQHGKTINANTKYEHLIKNVFIFTNILYHPSDQSLQRSRSDDPSNRFARKSKFAIHSSSPPADRQH